MVETSPGGTGVTARLPIRDLHVTSESPLEAVVGKVLQECQNGLISSLEVVQTDGDPGAELDAVVAVALSLHARVVRREHGLDVCVPRACLTLEHVAPLWVIAAHRLPTRGEAAFLRDAAFLEGSWDRVLQAARARGQAGDLVEHEDLTPRQRAQAIVAAGEQALAPRDRRALRRLLDHPSRLVEIIASDTLNAHSDATVPSLIFTTPRTRCGNNPNGAAFSERFEDRIDVDEYAFYEAVHPAYGRQVLELAVMVTAQGVNPCTLLDVGSGPGLPTIMLHELFPAARVDAVEPCPAAFFHLRRNISGLPIEAHHCGVEAFEGKDLYDVVSSVGASHHLDTRQFLAACRRLVKPDGLVAVADEMVSPFSSREERVENLIAHHWAYISEATAHIDPLSLPRLEQDRLARIRELSDLSEESLEALLTETSKNRTDHEDRSSAWPRVRLAVLELEALVAGLHYDVERKTFAENFVSLAHDEGLELLAHRRVFETHGDGEFGAGTHVFCFWRPR
jgi:SAM-dependent methyltransferase